MNEYHWQLYEPNKLRFTIKYKAKLQIYTHVNFFEVFENYEIG